MADDPRSVMLLALADDELITGHRASEWTGWVPYVEEDLAMSSIAQDELGHARALYELLVAIDGRDVDALALGRAPGEYRHAILCERPNRDYAYTIARHWLYDTADDVRLAALEETSFKELGELVAVFRLEERYHLDHASALFRRLADGPVDARRRLADALSSAIGEALALFEPLPTEESLLDDGTMPVASSELLTRWLERVGADLEAAGLEYVLAGRTDRPDAEMIPTSTGAIEHAAPSEPTRMQLPGLARRDGRWIYEGSAAGAGGRRGQHSQDFPPLWEEMTALYRAHPGARW